MRIFCGLTIVFLGCGSDDKAGFECSRGDREGMYFFQYDTVSGDCGDMPDQVGVIGGSDDGTCDVLSEDWSDDNCNLDRSVICELTSEDATMRIDGTTTQEDESGDVITGLLTITFRDLYTNAYICSGTYRMVAERQ